MKDALRWFCISIVFVAAVQTAAAQSERDYFEPVPEAFYEGLQFDMPRVEVPTFPDYSVSITDFGAVSDGETLNSEAFDEAIRHVSERGGGRVVVPEGILSKPAGCAGSA